MVIHCKDRFNDEDPENKKYLEHFNRFPYELSDFQKWAIYAIVNGHHSLITAHTGSGKTNPAEFAIQFFKELNKKVIYTAPIKALCNQKLYDLKQKFPNISFGILTGDVKDNPEADVLIMTTEILRNTLFTKKINESKTDKESETDQNKNIALQFEIDMDTELGAVVFDEVHYIGDQDRGSVWEQAILLLPPQVQLIMLSATIEKPEIFATWVETEKNKHLNNFKSLTILDILELNDTSIGEKDRRRDLYMTTTYERVVPLTHYAWITAQQSVLKDVKGTPYEEKCKDILNKPIVLASSKGIFNEINYHKINDILRYFQKNKVYVKRQYVLNDLVRYLDRHEMLPAICFVFSRRNVEVYAKEITFSLFDADDKIPSIIEHECEKILISKLRNYKEYIDLEEYRTMIALLKKGIAIHHAGIMPILREMVELLFEKKYIKLLFATETFAVGINMPTKTVIFTGLSKFSETGMRNLLAHEYTQMAGRAGRRGIDTIGHVIHCNNLFNNEMSCIEYKNMITGSPKMLTSQFKISFNLILNILSSNPSIKSSSSSLGNPSLDMLIEFMENSFIQTDIVKEINNYDQIEKELEIKIISAESNLIYQETCKTSKTVLVRYYEIQEKIHFSDNKQRKKLQRELQNIEDDNKYLKEDIEKYQKYNDLKREREKNSECKFEATNYIQNNIDNILKILKETNFINQDLELADKGIVAMQLQEVNSLALADLYEETKGFVNMTSIQIICLFSCFTNISIPEDKQLQFPDCVDPIVNNMAINMLKYINKYYDLEGKYIINTGTDYTIQFELIDYIREWCEAEDEVSCKNIILKLKSEKEIFLGEFIKAILKINNVAAEFEKICESLQNVCLLEKIKKIPKLTLKYVATNQSLYI
jgi:superfamily II RNA helicase